MIHSDNQRGPQNVFKKLVTMLFMRLKTAIKISKFWVQKKLLKTVVLQKFVNGKNKPI